MTFRHSAAGIALVLLLLSSTALLGAEFRAAAFFGGASSPETGSDWGGRLALDGAFSSILDEAWALRASSALDARLGSLSGPSALAGLSADLSLSLEAWTFALGGSLEGRVDGSGASLPSALAELIASLRLGEGLARAGLRSSRVEEEDGASGIVQAIIESGGELGGEFALGILVVSPGLSVAYRMPDITEPGILLSPRLGLSLYPSIPAWAEVHGEWERGLESGEDSFSLSIHLAWVPLPILETSLTGEATFESASTLLSASLSAALDLGRWGDKSLCLPVNLYLDNGGAFGAEAGLRFALE